MNKKDWRLNVDPLNMLHSITIGLIIIYGGLAMVRTPELVELIKILWLSTLSLAVLGYLTAFYLVFYQNSRIGVSQ